MILATRGGRDMEVRAWAGTYLPMRSSDIRQAAGVTVSNDSTAGIPAFTAAVRIAAQAVAVLDLGVYRGRGVDRTRVTSTWQARLLAGEPNDQQDAYQFKETIEESLSFRGNAYVWKSIDPATGRVLELYALHPDQVMPYCDSRGRRFYSVGVSEWFVDPVGRGNATYDVGAGTILHVKGFGDGGGWIAPSPVQRFATALGISIAKMDHESSMFSRGAAIRLAVTYPETMTQEKASVWRDMWRSTYEGPQNAGKTAVLGGGGTLQQIGLSQTDAQFIESSRFSIEEIARMTGVTASLIGGGQGNGGDAPITPEHEQARWLRHGLGPRLARIESSLRADSDLFGDGARDYPMFDTTGVVRGDVATEADVSLKKVQSGQWLVDEARALDGLPPLPDGVGSIPQIVPVGGAPNPNGQTSTNPPATDPAVKEATP